ncbi:MAG: cobalamin biosynthesis protein P47K, partial [Pirellulales bacterium]|nr:cobalamin biosynthesis protein P47K [Pirellulales bacterium]
MTETKKVRFVLIGGFLGAGKTTLIGELARRYVRQGKRVGIITNDQADNLVDTQNLRSQGFEVGEVAGACFCCSFNELVATADSLGADEAPDVLLAEPVGSCTDLVATVILPLQQLLGERFELAPFGVLLKPAHGRKILADSPAARSGFSPQAEYIFRKQLEEADYLMIGRRDQLSDAEIQQLRADLAKVAGSVPLIAVSPKSGLGVDEVVQQIEQPPAGPRRLLEIDYDTYADGEAELGWVNLTAVINSDVPVDLDRLAAEVVQRISHEIAANTGGQIAHLKASVLAAGAQAVANVVSNDSGVDVGLSADRSVAGSLEMIVNARVAIDPEILERACRDGLQEVA